MSKGTTQPGFVNPHGQEVLRRTNLPGNDHLQYTYVLRSNLFGRVWREWLGHSPSPLSFVPGRAARPAYGVR
jgi:hypothetical protein